MTATTAPGRTSTQAPRPALEPSGAPRSPLLARRGLLARPGLAVGLPVLLAAVLTAWRYDAKPLWRDEVYTLTTSSRGLGEMFQLLAERDAGLVGFYTLMHGWLQLDSSTAWLRLLSALATVAAVGLGAALGRRVGGAAVGLLSGLLLAVVPAVVTHGQEPRPYPLVLVSTTATALLLLRSTEAPSRWRWVALSGVAVLPGVLHPLVGLPAAGALFLAAWALPARASRRAVVLAGLPAALLGTALVAVGFLQQVESPPAPATPEEFFTFWRIVGWGVPSGLVVFALAVVGARVLLPRREAVLLIGWAVVPVLAVTALGLSGSYFNARYASAAVPAIAVLAAAGIVHLRRAVPRWGAVAAPLAAAAVLVAGLVGAGEYRSKAHDFDDPVGAARALVVGAEPGDAVVYVGPVARPLVRGYLPSEDLGGRLDDALLVAEPEDSVTLGGRELPGREKEAALAPYRRVWVVGTVATATEDLARGSWSAEAAMAGRSMVSREDHGALRVELWAGPGTGAAPGPAAG